MSRRRGAFKLVSRTDRTLRRVQATDASERIKAEFRLGQDKQLPDEPEEVSRLIKGF